MSLFATGARWALWLRCAPIASCAGRKPRRSDAASGSTHAATPSWKSYCGLLATLALAGSPQLAQAGCDAEHFCTPPGASLTLQTAALGTTLPAVVAAPLASLNVHTTASDRNPDGTAKVAQIETTEQINSAVSTDILVDTTLHSATMSVSVTHDTTLTNLSAGKYTFITKVGNGATSNNVAYSTPVVLIVDNAPTASISAPSGTLSGWNGSSLAVSIAGSIAATSGVSIASAQLLVDGSSTPVASLSVSGGSVSGTYSLTSSGAHSFAILVTDSLGLQGVSSWSSVFIDVPPSSVAISSPAAGNILLSGGSATLAVAGTYVIGDGTASPTATLLMDNSPVATLTASGGSVSGSYVLSATGSHGFQIKITDAHGGSAQSGVVSVYADGTPTVSMTSPVASTVVSNGVSATINVAGSVTVTDGSTPTAVLLMDGSQVATLSVSGGSVSSSYLLRPPPGRTPSQSG